MLEGILEVTWPNFLILWGRNVEEHRRFPKAHPELLMSVVQCFLSYSIRDDRVLGFVSAHSLPFSYDISSSFCNRTS